MQTLTISGQSDSELEARLVDIAQRVAAANSRHEHRARRRFRDPDLRKYLERMSDALSDLTRLLLTASLPTEQRRRLPVLLEVAHACLDEVTTETAWSLLHDFELLLIEAGDAQVICGLVAGELQWRKAQTSWLTWDALFKGDEAKCKALDLYVEGAAIPSADLESARHKLLALYRARHNDEEAHRSRATLRGQNLLVLTSLLLLLLPLFLLAYRHGANPRPSTWTLVMLPLAGALGAGISGTLKARDRLTREADIRRFRYGLIAQLLVGGSSAVIVVTLLQAKLVTIGHVNVGPHQSVAQAAFGLVAGFSEPFVLDTIGRATKLGSSQDASDKSKTSK